MATKKRQYATRDDILGARDLAVEELCVPEWGNLWVRVQAMDAAVGQRFTDALVSSDDFGIRIKAVAFSLVDEGGQRLFTEADIEALARKNFAPIRRISSIAFRLNGLGMVGQEAVQQAAENLAPAQDGASPSA